MWASLGEYSKIGGVCVDRAKRIGRWGHWLVGALQGGKPKQADWRWTEVDRGVPAPQDRSNTPR